MPASLRALVAEKDYGSAVLLYSNAQPLLQAHGHIGLLRPISQEAHNIMQAASPLTPVSNRTTAYASDMLLEQPCMHERCAGHQRGADGPVRKA